MSIEFPMNAVRSDPFKNFKFRISFGPGLPPVAGMQKISGLKRTTAPIDWRSAGDPSVTRKMPGVSVYQPITLEKGVTFDNAFQDWANRVNKYTKGANTPDQMNLGGEIPGLSYRRNINIQLLNEQGIPVIGYNVYRAWVSEYQAMPDLDSNGKAVAITMMKLEIEGFERDGTVETKEI
jgi:phage tail-like protein